MRNTKLTAPPKGAIARNSNGGNGGYSKKAPPRDIDGPRRAFNLRDYAGKRIKKA